MAEQEQILLQGVKNSDKTAFHKLFSDFHDTLFRFVAYRVQDADLAEDIAQETFFRVWRTRESIQPKKIFFFTDCPHQHQSLLRSFSPHGSPTPA